MLPKLASRAIFSAFTLFTGSLAYGQLSATVSTTPNTICDGSDCQYSGPSILINEIMMSPTTFDGSLWEPNCNANARCGEWIELYNPNICEPVDVSCYYLGNNAPDGFGNYPGGYTIPPGTIIPPRGFLLLRGSNSTGIDPALLVQNGGNTVEIIVTSPNTCIGGGTRLWFPNSGAWFAFYDNNGVPQDAVSWGSSPANLGNAPCVTPVATCSFSGTLPTYNQIPNNRKNLIYNTALPNSWGRSLRRFPDGGNWELNTGTTNLTAGNCNGTCVPPPVITCNGTATVNPTGGSGTYTYHWDDTQSQLTQTATGLCAGTYHVQVTDNLGATAQFTVVVDEYVPPVTLDVTSQVCIDVPAFALGTATPTPTAGQTGVYSGPGVTGSNFNPQTAGAGTHNITYTFTDENGCTNSASDPIVVNALPVLSVTVDNPYCISPDPEQIVVSPAGGTLTGPGVTGTNFVSATAGVGSHTLTYAYTDANGCANSTTASAQVVALPTPSITAPNTICANASPITLTGSPAGGTFYINSTQTNNLNPATIGAGVQNLSYEYTDANGCQATATDQIDVFAVPNVTVTVTPVVCIDAGIIAVATSPATGTGGTGVLTGPGVSGTNFNPQTAGQGSHTLTYTFTTTDGCVNASTDGIVVNPLPAPSITGINPTYCVSNVPVSFNLQPSGGTLSGPGVTNNTFIPSVAGVGTHTITYSITDANSCSASITANVVVVAVPSPTITTPDSLCNYAPQITLIGTPSGGVFTVDGTQTATFNPATAGDGVHNIVYTYTDANNCIATATETIKVLPRPSLSTNLAAHYCYGTGIVPLTLSPAGGTLSGNWVSGNSLDLTNRTPGNYSITYQYVDDKGCENTLNSPYVLTSPIHPDFTYSTDCFQNSSFVNLTVPAGNWVYNWEFAGIGESVLTNPTLHYDVFGNHVVTLTATDSYNCSYDSTKAIYVNEGVSIKDFVIPNIITANGDGINDVIQLPALLEECITYRILILNRWGNLVYEMTSAQNAFAGNDKGGKELQAGVYFYIVESPDIDCNSDLYKGFCSGIITVAK